MDVHEKPVRGDREGVVPVTLLKINLEVDIMFYLLGLVFVTLAGLGTGSAAWPFKVSRNLRQEKYLLLTMGTALVFIPWTVVSCFLPDPIGLIREVGWKPLVVSNLFSLCWGIANILYVVCVLRIGAALTGAILSAAGMSVGVLLPLVFKGSGQFQGAADLFSVTGLLIVSGLIVVFAGIFLVTIAGSAREKVLNKAEASRADSQASGSFWTGFFLVLLAGFLSAGLSLSFVYGQGPIVDAAGKQGAGPIVATITVWALAVFGGAMVNILYAVVLLTKNRTWFLLLENHPESFYSILGGIQFIVSIVLLGQGMVFLGVLGASVGFGIQQSMQIVGNQLVGFLGGEWKGVTGKPRNVMYAALVVIFLAVVILSFSHFIESRLS